MANALTLFPDEFSSLVKIGNGALLEEQIPAGHVLKLSGLRYIETINGQYRATTTGLFRIASGS
jgi:hypothetical protein